MAIHLDALSTAMRSSAQASTPAPKTAPEQATVAAPEPVKASVPPPPDIEAVVEQLNRMMQRMNNSLQFEVDRSTGKTVVRVLDSNTNEILRQFPSEEVLAIARALENAKGALLSDLA
ncbi:MAG TPA: flagellar protein FlaG [Burkholderiales bacterium]|nr:flagellar protein FlaG [Burkholderiales bacterium]